RKGTKEEKYIVYDRSTSASRWLGGVYLVELGAHDVFLAPHSLLAPTSLSLFGLPTSRLGAFESPLSRLPDCVQHSSNSKTQRQLASPVSA
ncbi:unnamed protein product, partial [Chrysoparadoxa australica]